MRDPFITITPDGKKFVANGRDGATIKTCDNPFDLVEEIANKHIAERPDHPAPFTGGLAGFFGYDLLRFTEPATKLSKPATSDEGDLWLGLYDKVLAFDHEKEEVWAIVNYRKGEYEEELFIPLDEWLRQAGDTKEKALDSNGRSENNGRPSPVSNFSRAEYINAVNQVRNYIKAGDCYQANIAQRFSIKNGPHPKDLYLFLREINPSLFAAYIGTGKAVILSSSPERFIKLDDDGKIEASPIKGTRPRGKTPKEDERLIKELADDPKERAENIMIVDLLRNDISKVSEPGEVKVTELCAVKTFPTVIHLVSTIIGKLKTSCSAVDLLRATFPCGSVTGAPKIRAMEIIDEIEPASRGVYCGAIGYLGFDQRADFSVAIRVMVLANGEYSFCAGGGVTWPSDPDAEYDETLAKARALKEAIAKCPTGR